MQVNKMSDNLICKVCNKKFSKLSNLRVHATKFHSENVDEIAPYKMVKRTAICNQCSKTFSRYSSLSKHVKDFHPDKINSLFAKKKYKFNCGVCRKNFSHEKHFKAHKQIHHQNINKESKSHHTNMKCPLCNYEDSVKSQLILHFRAHDIVVKSEVTKCSNFEDFTCWKNKLEKDTNAQYTNKHGTRNSINFKRTTYVCHRSGTFKSRGRGFRHLKTQGTSKINGYCPAEITVTLFKNNGECEVNFTKTHIGHDNDLGHLRLTNTERAEVAAKIAAKIPFSTILDEVRDSVTNCDLERKHLLTMKDMYNIEKSYNLNSNSMRHKNDAISVESWVLEMEKYENVFLFYKAQDTECDKYPNLLREDFLLIFMTDGQLHLLEKYGDDCICIDGTHGTNPYDFELTTLLVLDDLREGFPCAYLISNRTDEQVMRIFFNEIKERLNGRTMQPKVFMSDMAPSFYNAWINTMQPVDYRLFCVWHVDRAWRQNLNKIASKDERVMVYKQLRIILQERDEAAFWQMLENFLCSLLSSESTMEFGNYFKLHYANHVNSWAYCFRLNAGLNTNMHLERMHRTLKYLYMGGKQVKRLDKGISAIMKFTKDKLFERVVTISKGKISAKIKEIRKRHKASDQLDINTVIPVEYGWLVASSSAKEIYVIEDRNQNCNCKLTCTDCVMCLHRYSCTCLDASTRCNMCKHIHLVCKYIRQGHEKSGAGFSEKPMDYLTGVIEDTPLIVDDSKEDMEEAATIIKSLCHNKEKLDSESKFKAEKEKLKLSFLGIIEDITSIEELEAVTKIMTPIQPTIAAIRNQSRNTRLSQFKVATNMSNNKNIVPQRRLFKTKKTNKINKHTNKCAFERPDEYEGDVIAINLLHSV